MDKLLRTTNFFFLARKSETPRKREVICCFKFVAIVLLCSCSLLEFPGPNKDKKTGSFLLFCGQM